MKKITLIMALFVGSACAVYAQDAKPVPKFAQPTNEADKPAVERAKAQTAEMTQTLKLTEDQALTVLEINVGIERQIASIPAGDPEKNAKLQQLEEKRVNFYETYLTSEQLIKYNNK